MSFLTGLALRRRSVTLLIMVILLFAGLITYGSLERQLFPEIESPIITIITVYPSTNPDTVERDVTKPIEEAMGGMTGLKEVQSTSSENLSVVIASFEFGTDMDEAERDIESGINGLSLPAGVEDSLFRRIDTDLFPVLQLTVLGGEDIPSLQRIVEDLILPSIDRVDGVFSTEVVGEIDEQVVITVDPDKLGDLGLSLQQVSTAIKQNNVSIPAGDVVSRGESYSVRTAHQFGFIEEIRNLTIGFDRSNTGGATSGVNPASSSVDNRSTDNGSVDSRSGQRRVLLSDVAEVELSTAEASSISRTNGKPSLGIVVVKESGANTLDVTDGVLEELEIVEAESLPPDVEILILSNDSPRIRAQLSSLLREGMFGFMFAIAVVFVFLINVRPHLVRGLVLTLRPTLVIGLSIPLSIMVGIVLIGIAGLSLNLMTLAGLAIAVGRVVDDSIVVMENMYRHIQRGEDRAQAALDATREVAGAITSSTLTTIVVFLPLVFIQGLVGSFFTPFAMSVSFALIGSLLVALTITPVLGAMLLRRGDFPDDGDVVESGVVSEDADTLMQRIYTPILLWSLRHKVATLVIAFVITIASLALVRVIPVTLFPAGDPEIVTINLELPTGASAGRTFKEVLRVEDVLARLREGGTVESYQTTIGGVATRFGPAREVGGGLDIAGVFVQLSEEVPEDIADQIRTALPGNDETTIKVEEIVPGAPQDNLEVIVIGPNLQTITPVAKQLEASISLLPGVANVSSDVTGARNEVVIRVDPELAAEFGLTTASVGRQVSRYNVGEMVSEVNLEEITMRVVVRGPPGAVDDIDKLNSLTIQGPSPLEQVKLGLISSIAIEKGPVSLSRFDLERSASITGTIIGEDTQEISDRVDDIIDRLDLPPGVEVKTGGVFEQVREGFQDIFLAMAVGILLVYLVMVASLGSLRNPLIIVASLPLALVGALVALAITDRTLSLSAMMGLLLLIGVVVTNAIVLITFVEQLRERGLGVQDALLQGSRVRLRPILMTAFTTDIALLPLAVFVGESGLIIGAELATVVIGGLISSTFLTLIVVPVVYTIVHESIPGFFGDLGLAFGRTPPGGPPAGGPTSGGAPSGSAPLGGPVAIGPPVFGLVEGGLARGGGVATPLPTIREIPPESSPEPSLETSPGNSNEGWTPAFGLLIFTRWLSVRLDRLYLALGWFCGLELLLLGFFITYQIVARKLEWPMAPATGGLSGLILAMAATWSFSYALRSGANVRIDVLLPFMGRNARAFADFAAMGAVAFLATVTSWMIWDSVVDHSSSPTLMAKIVIGVGFSMMAFTAWQMMFVIMAEGFLPRVHRWMGGGEIETETTEATELLR